MQPCIIADNGIEIPFWFIMRGMRKAGIISEFAVNEDFRSDRDPGKETHTKIVVFFPRVVGQWAIGGRSFEDNDEKTAFEQFWESLERPDQVKAGDAGLALMAGMRAEQAKEK